MSYLLLALLVLVAGFAAYVRFAPSDPARWHVDPLAVGERGAMNSHLVGPGGDREIVRMALPPDQLAARLEAIARDTPRTELLAGEGFHRTWVTRTKWWGFPDYTSVRLVPTDDGGTELAIFARARFGKGDLGVNRARVEDWLTRLGAPPAP